MVHEIVELVVKNVSKQPTNEQNVEVLLRQDLAPRVVVETAQDDKSWNGWEYQSVSVLRESVVDAMDHEVTSEDPFVVGYVMHPVIFAMEEESVECVFSKRPPEDSSDNYSHKCEWVGNLGVFISPVDCVAHPWRVGNWDRPPRSHRACFQDFVLKQLDVSNRVNEVLGLIDIGDVFIK